MANYPSIDLAYNAGFATAIVPFKAIFNDTENVTHLRITATNDNLTNSCSLFWEVLNAKKEKRVSGVYVITDADYELFKEDKKYSFVYVAEKLNIQFA